MWLGRRNITREKKPKLAQYRNKIIIFFIMATKWTWQKCTIWCWVTCKLKEIEKWCSDIALSIAQDDEIKQMSADIEREKLKTQGASSHWKIFTEQNKMMIVAYLHLNIGNSKRKGNWILAQLSAVLYWNLGFVNLSLTWFLGHKFSLNS